MAVALDHVSSMAARAARRNTPFTLEDASIGTTGAAAESRIRARLLAALQVQRGEDVVDVRFAGRGSAAAGASDVVVAGIGMQHLAAARAVASDLLARCRAGGRIGIACPAPGSFLNDISRVIDRYATRARHDDPQGFVGTRKALNDLFGEHACALGAADRCILLRYPSAEHWLADWKATYKPLGNAYRVVEPEWRGQFTDALLAVVERHGRRRDHMFSIPCYYLEFLVHKCWTP